MHLYAVLSDIHANLAALESVQADAEEVSERETGSRRAVEFVCLGDVVDYGPQPNECVAWVSAHVAPELLVIGNHDEQVLSSAPPVSIDRKWWPITLWTRMELDPVSRKALSSWQSRELRAPGSLRLFTLAHANFVFDKSESYIDEPAIAKINFGSLSTPFGLVGHTHIQGCFVQNSTSSDMVLAGDWDPGASKAPSQLKTWPLPPLPGARKQNGDDSLWSWSLARWRQFPEHVKIIFNPGSVGQARFPRLLLGRNLPRRSHAAYMMLKFNGRGIGEFQFRQVQYDVQKTIAVFRDKLRDLKSQTGVGCNILDTLPPPNPGTTDSEEMMRIYQNLHSELSALVDGKLIGTLLNG